jgi:hypothetical protein
MQAGSAAMFTAVVPKPFPLGFGLSPVKGFLCEMTENMQADDVQKPSGMLCAVLPLF